MIYPEYYFHFAVVFDHKVLVVLTSVLTVIDSTPRQPLCPSWLAGSLPMDTECHQRKKEINHITTVLYTVVYCMCLRESRSTVDLSLWQITEERGA